MAATPLTVNTITEANPIASATPVAADATNGNSVQNGATVWLEMTSSAGGTVSVAYANKVDGQTVPARTYTLTGAQTLRAGSFPVNLFGQTLTVTASASTITLAAYQLG